VSSCPALSQLPLLPACPDLTILNDPQRLVSLHAVDAATGVVVDQIPTLPTFTASTYTNGVVFLPDSLAGGVAAFNADTGAPLWAYPLGSVPASGAAIAGDSIFLGSGEGEGGVPGQALPPQLSGIWSFSTNPTELSVTPPSP
ncbi:MAG TPA: PQQ-binding-like beta-propeller repeat protein, partial [Acidimicrobiales bacterium]|nr:PQQ-binding-like beta-propeller repeat protein [Acidimicrobiales bacterium]